MQNSNSLFQNETNRVFVSDYEGKDREEAFSEIGIKNYHGQEKNENVSEGMKQCEKIKCPKEPYIYSLIEPNLDNLMHLGTPKREIQEQLELNEFKIQETIEKLRNKFTLRKIVCQNWDLICSMTSGDRPFTRQEVLRHGRNGDILVIKNKIVLNFTSLYFENLEKFPEQVKLIANSRGTDISHWFYSKTDQPLSKCNLIINGESWWKNSKYFVGYIPDKTYFIRIVNSLNLEEKIFEVSGDMTLNDVLRGYLTINSNAMNYIWKDIFGNVLHPNRNLEENGLLDHSEINNETGLDYFSTIILHYNTGIDCNLLDCSQFQEKCCNDNNNEIKEFDEKCSEAAAKFVDQIFASLGQQLKNEREENQNSEFPSEEDNCQDAAKVAAYQIFENSGEKSENNCQKAARETVYQAFEELEDSSGSGSNCQNSAKEVVDQTFECLKQELSMPNSSGRKDIQNNQIFEMEGKNECHAASNNFTSKLFSSLEKFRRESTCKNNFDCDCESKNLVTTIFTTLEDFI